MPVLEALAAPRPGGQQTPVALLAVNSESPPPPSSTPDPPLLMTYNVAYHLVGVGQEMGLRGELLLLLFLQLGGGGGKKCLRWHQARELAGFFFHFLIKGCFSQR